MSLDKVLTLLDTMVDGIDGITSCTQQPEVDPPEDAYPFATVYAQTGVMTVQSSTLQRDIHTIGLDVHVSSEVVPEAFTAAKIWPERVVAAFKADETLQANSALVVWPIEYRSGPMEWTPEVVHYVVHFDIPIKVNST